jgi:hypothetical protein
MRPSVTPRQREQVCRLRRQLQSSIAIARQVHLSESKVLKIISADMPHDERKQIARRIKQAQYASWQPKGSRNGAPMPSLATQWLRRRWGDIQAER